MNIVMNDRVEIGDENVGMVAENGEVSTLDKEYLDKLCAHNYHVYRNIFLSWFAHKTYPDIFKADFSESNVKKNLRISCENTCISQFLDDCVKHKVEFQFQRDNGTYVVIVVCKEVVELLEALWEDFNNKEVYIGYFLEHTITMIKHVAERAAKGNRNHHYPDFLAELEKF